MLRRPPRPRSRDRCWVLGRGARRSTANALRSESLRWLATSRRQRPQGRVSSPVNVSIMRNFSGAEAIQENHMDVGDKNRYWRPAVLVLICLLHGALIIVLLRAKPAYKSVRASELLVTIYLINAGPRRVPLPRLETRVTSRGLGIERMRVLPPESLSISAQSPSSPDYPTPATPPAVDWLAEAQRSAAEVVSRTAPDRAAATQSPPTRIAPWDPHSQSLETTGHGLKLQLIDPCFSDLDLGQTVYGAEARLQLGCTLGRRPARGDLFDSLTKPQPNK